jgi:hypothetical protein
VVYLLVHQKSLYFQEFLSVLWYTCYLGQQIRFIQIYVLSDFLFLEKSVAIFNDDYESLSLSPFLSSGTRGWAQGFMLAKHGSTLWVTHPVYFALIIFNMGSCLGKWNMILPISASQVASITDTIHQCLAGFVFLP